MNSADPRRAIPILAAFVLGLSACSPSSQDAGGTAGAEAATPAVPTTLAEMPSGRLAERADPSDFCSLDTVDGELLSAELARPIANPASTRLRGWVGDRVTLERPPSPVLRIVSADRTRGWEIAVGPPTARGDVARHFDAGTMQMSGFDFVVDLSALPPGEYVLSLHYLSSGRAVACDKGRRIVVKG